MNYKGKYFFLPEAAYLKSIILILMLISPALFGLSFEDQEEKVQEALKAMNRMEHEEAYRLFKEVRDSEPYHPLAPFGTLANKWMVNQATKGFEAGNDEMLREIDGVIDEYRQRLLIEPDNPDLKYYMGLTNGLRARVQLSEKKWLSVMISGYKIIRYLKSALKENPENPDVIIAFGVFNYYVGMSSGFMQIASWILQLSGSKEEGLKQIEYAALNGNYSRYEARNILAFSYLYFEGEYKSAQHWLAVLRAEFPNNPYYAFLAAEAELQTGNPNIDEQIAKITNKLPELNLYTKLDYYQRLTLLRGTRAMLENNLAIAEYELKQFVDNYYSELDYDLTSGYLRLGQVYDLQGKRAQAIEQYRKAIALDNRTVATLKAAQYLKKPYVKNP
jgi:tetratricopeptide (TPR) repeat protein